MDKRFLPCYKKVLPLIAAFLVYGLMASISLASPYDAYGVRPGDVITNTISVAYETDGSPRQPLTASSNFTVAHLPPNGTIRAFQAFQGAGLEEQFPLLAGTYSQTGMPGGAQVPLPSPLDTSGLVQNAPFTLPGLVSLQETAAVVQGVPVVFVIEDETLNIRSDEVDTVVVRLTDSVTGDNETLVFTETSPSSGVFTGWINTGPGSAQAGNGVLETAFGSRIDAVYSDPDIADFVLSVSVLVTPPAPEGRVFNSTTGALLNGISLTLFDISTNQPAIVRSADLTATLPATVSTGEDLVDSLGRVVSVDPGSFVFPYLEPGTYELRLGPNQPFSGPSGVAPAALQALPGAPWLLEAGSFLNTFTVAPGVPVRFDIPLDPVLGEAALVRLGSIDTGSVGEAFEYEVTIIAPSSGLITFVDDLPTGIRFIPGTFTIDGRPVTPLVSANGRQLTFQDVPVQAGVPMVLRYGARIGAQTDTRSWTRLTTLGLPALRDDHAITLEDPFGLQETVILGEILAGPCGEPHQERDLEGIRVYLETGDYAITDARGMFTFRDIERRPRVVQVDERTLPEGASLVLCTNTTRSAGSALSRFVDVGPGQMGRVDFRIVFDESAITPPREPFVLVDPAEVYSDAWFLEQAINGPALLSPSDDFSVTSPALDIIFVRHRDASASILVNGEERRPSSAAPALTHPDGPWVLERWRGVRIEPGISTVVFETNDIAGVRTHRSQVEIPFATDVARLEWVSMGEATHLDASTRPSVRLRLTDAAGVPVRAGTRVQLSVEAPFAFLPGPERDSASGASRRPVPSLAVEVERDGMIEVRLAPVTTPGTVRMAVNSPRGPIGVEIPVRLDAQPWILVGLAEGTLAERTVREHLRPLTADDNSLAGRVAFFAEGVIQGRWLLTLRYDSDASGEFYQIDPDKDYLVYGDRSIQGSDAQSRFPLYVRLRSEEAEVLLGDFRLDIETMLIRETRKVSGLRALYETDTFRAMAFVAETDQRLVRDRIALNGTIGPYGLSQTDIVPASETVSLIVVSRLDATLESPSRTLVAGVDYVLDYATGRLFLREPISAFTESFDRHVLVVDYESDRDISDTRLAGVRVEGAVSPRVRVGGTVMHATRVEGRDVSVTLGGLDVTYEISDRAVLRAEVLEVDKRVNGVSHRSSAQEVRYEYTTLTTQAYARLRQQRGDVEINANVSEDRITIGQVGISHRVSGPTENPSLGTFVEGTATMERNHTDGTERQQVDLIRRHRDERHAYGGGLSFSRSVQDDGRVIEEIAGVAQGARTSLDDRFREEIELRGVLHSTADKPLDRLSFGLEYDVTPEVAVFARFFGSQERGVDEMETAFTLGMRARPWTGFDGTVALSHAGAGGVQGLGLYTSLTQEWQLDEERSVSFGVDAQRDFGAHSVPFGDTIGNPFIDEDFVSARVGYRHVTETWALAADVEGRAAESGDTANLRLRADGEVGNDWSVGGEVFAGWERPTTGPVRQDIEVRFAAAQRRLGREPITLLQAEYDRSWGDDARNELYLSATHNRFIGERGELGARYAVKVTQTDLSVGSFTGITQFGGLEYRHDLSERFDLGIQGAVMHDHATSLTHSSYGVSLGLTPFDNAWASVGYNFEGFHDEQFSAGGYTNAGPFLQFRLKFDQDTVKSMFR